MTAVTMNAPDSATPWYRQRWPWLVFAGPGIVVVAALATAWLAASGQDPVLADDYYKQGLLVNKRKAAQAPAPVDPAAMVRVGADGTIRVQLDGVSPETQPVTMRLLLVHPTRHADDRAATLARLPDGTWTGRIDATGAGRWIVTLESDRWRLPTTIVDGGSGEIRLGARADAH